MTQIRVATPNDTQEIAVLCAQLGYPSSMPLTANRLVSILQSGNDAVFVACLPDGLVVGWIHVFLAHRVESDTFAELGGFVVEETHRWRGIGRALLVAAEQWSVEQGVAKLRVRTRSGRVEARVFYEHLGFQLAKEQHIYDKGLVPKI